MYSVISDFKPPMADKLQLRGLLIAKFIAVYALTLISND